MRRGLIKDYANAVCGIVSGWQADDERLPHLQQHGTGVLEIDVLAEAARIDGVAVRMPTSTTILRSWLKNAAKRDAWEGKRRSAARMVVRTSVARRAPSRPSDRIARSTAPAAGSGIAVRRRKTVIFRRPQSPSGAKTCSPSGLRVQAMSRTRPT